MSENVNPDESDAAAPLHLTVYPGDNLFSVNILSE